LGSARVLNHPNRKKKSGPHLLASAATDSFFALVQRSPRSLPSDDTQEGGIYRFVCVDAKAGAFVPK